MKYNLFRFISLFMIHSELQEVNYEDILSLREKDVNWSDLTVTLTDQVYTLTPETMRFLEALREHKPEGQELLFIN